MTTELDWRDRATTTTCVVCRFEGPAQQVAEVNALGRVGIEVVRCPGCGSVAMSGEVGDVTPDDAAIDAYVEAGAGIDAIASGLDVVDPASVRRMLDVGCNYGFGLDVARFLHGWDTVGVEPSPAGRRGARELDLDIRDGYVTDTTDLGGGFDLVLASEVVEHVPDPRAFLATLARQLTPRGILVLTTPAAEAVVPDNLDEHVLIALSPGFHGFLASAEGLRLLLTEAGFAGVSVRRDGGTLRARASLADDVVLEREGAATDRATLEAYYDHRAAAAPAGSALANGMATRHLRSAVNRGDLVTAAASAPRAVAGLRERHGFDLDHPADVADALRAGRAPAWNLAGLAYGLGMLELLRGERPDRAAELFGTCLVAIDAWRRHAGLLDGDSADLRAHAARHRALARVRADATVAAEALADAAPLLPTTGRRQLTLQLFVDLVSAGRHDAAAGLADDVAASASDAAAAVEPGLRRAGLDALYCLATHAAARGDLAGSALWSVRARRALAAAPDADLAVLHAGLDAHDGVLAGLAAQAAARSLEPASDGLEDDAAAAPTEQPSVSLVPAAFPAHGIDAYWVDASGVHLRGWAHHGDEPVLQIALERGGARVAQAPVPRPDLQAFWPGVPTVVDAGFDLYLPGPADAPVELVLTTASGEHRTRPTLPDHPLPAPVGDAEADRRAFADTLAALLADAPDGPVLAIGLRSEDGVEVSELRAVLSGRELVVLDVHPGTGVDVVGDAHDLVGALPGRTFAAVCSAMVLEHVVAPWLVAEQVNRVLVTDGLSAHVAPTAWPEHALPNDFWRFTTGGLAELFGPRTGFDVLAVGSYGELRLHPVGSWVDLGQRAMPTHGTPGASWVVARKSAELPAGAVRWPYDLAEGLAVARAYPVDGLAPGRPRSVPTQQSASAAPAGSGATPEPPSASRPDDEAAPASSTDGSAPQRLTVSVVLPLYQGARYVEKAVRSIAGQSRLPDELVVVDDGSTDDGADRVRALDLPFRVTVLTQSNQGQSAARNTGIAAATSDLVALIDQDDEWRRNHLEVLAPVLEADPDVGWAYSDFDELDEHGRTVTLSFIRELSVPHPKTTLSACLQGDLMVLPSASVLRRSALLAVGGFDPRLRGYEDDDLFVRMFTAGWGHEFVPVSTTRYRVHASGSSAGLSFLRSRMIFLEKLISDLEVDHRLNRDFVHDVVLPRFFQSTLNEYTQAIALREYGRALELAAALRTISGLQERRGWRRRLELHLVGHPRRLRHLLVAVQRLPRRIRPHVNRDLDLANRTVVRSELRTR